MNLDLNSLVEITKFLDDIDAKNIDKNLAEFIFETYFKYMKVSRAEAMARALLMYDKKIFDYYYNN